MTTWNSSAVDDPEKHFLGNLLEDDSSFSAPPPSQSRRDHSSSGIPAVSVIAGLGPLSVGGPSPSQSFWPEPPPPYSQTVQHGQSSWSAFPEKTTSSSPLSDLIQSGMKETYEWDSIISGQNSPFLPPTTSVQGSGVIAQTQIHHHHHSLHHHTHMHSVVENHHHYINEAREEEPGNEIIRKSVREPASKPISKPFAAVVGKQKAKKPPAAPHSAPIQHKMPFSYRDVAARNDSGSHPGHVAPQQVRKSNTSVVESDSRSDSAPSQEAITPPGSKQCALADSKGKTDQEFQQISRKRSAKEKKKVVIGSVVPIVENVPPKPFVPTKYHVLEKLAMPSPKIVKNEDSTEDHCQEKLPSSVVAVRSRSSSYCGGEDEDSGQRGRRESKKRLQQPKKRTHRRKCNSSFWIFGLLWTYILCAVEAVQDAFKWLMTLIVDVCSNMADIATFAFFAVINGVVNTIRQCLVVAYLTLRDMMMSLRVLDVRRIWTAMKENESEDQNGVTKWGLEDNMSIPTTAEEALDRLLRVRHVDAYSVLGLRADCSDDEIRRYHKKLAALYGCDKILLDGVDEAQDLVAKAFLAIGNPEARKAYNLVTLHKNLAHKEIVYLWESVRDAVEEARHSMYCDCGRRHARIPTKIRPQEARYCKRCGSRHLARSNDIWVESSFLGLIWRYYTCTEGVVYEITDWASCETNYLKHLRPDSHAVQYRLVSPSAGNDRLPLREIMDSLEPDMWYSGRNGAQVLRPLEHRDEDRSRRAANRRQKRR